MNRYGYLSTLPALFLCTSVGAETLEPKIESSPVAMIVFFVIFVGFCAGFAWMVWRKKEKKND